MLGLANQILDCTDIDWCGDDGVVVCRLFSNEAITLRRQSTCGHVACSIRALRSWLRSLCHAPLSCALLVWVSHAAAACGREKRNEALVALQVRGARVSTHHRAPLHRAPSCRAAASPHHVTTRRRTAPPRPAPPPLHRTAPPRRAATVLARVTLMCR